MASLNRTSTGFTVQFVSPEGKRKSIRLGDLTKTQCENVKSWVERLNALQIAGIPIDEPTARWLAGLGDQLHDRIAATGLTAKRSSGLLGDFLRNFIAEHSESVSPPTRTNWSYTIANLVERFGANKSLREMTNAGNHFRIHLKSIGLAENTVRLRCRIAGQMFSKAVKERRLETNPFAEVPTTILGKRQEFFVTQEIATAVLDACPGDNWRLYFALARFGGLRVPSETRNLRWSDVNWDRGKIRIQSQKTARHEGKAERFIPLFRTLEPYLLKCFHLAPAGDALVLPAIFDSGSTTRSQMDAIIKRAGLTPWAKTMANCRSSRQTELLGKFSSHVVAGWLGHSTATAGKFYSQLTAQDFAAGAAE